MPASEDPFPATSNGRPPRVGRRRERDLLIDAADHLYWAAALLEELAERIPTSD